ncbi:hypothetical protein OHC33_007102 [Knufia fluminis]|uniref:Uncharacterized protein n=1 Tax=Knufia fluminis TaxID=191047 RepID=A0AAN8EKT7_9EURO|nr:hypothetical protein OHC33_007102 [Knufia fluminis]
MSAMLVRDMSPDTVEDALTQLNSLSRGSPNLSENLSVGPFGCSTMRPSSTITPGRSQQIVQDPAAPYPSPPSHESHTSSSGANMSSTPTLPYLDNFDPFSSHVPFHPQQHNYADDTPDAFFTDTDHGTGSFGHAPTNDITSSSLCNERSNPQIPNITNMHQEPPDLCTNDGGPLKDAEALLAHFDGKVAWNLGPPTLSSSSPWKTLNLSNAVQTVAEMKILKKTNHDSARLANLYGLLACSAYHKSSNPTVNPQRSYWEDVVIRVNTIAKEQVERGLRRRGRQGSERPRYEHQLMALLICLAFAMMSGSTKDARCYLLEAEQLVRCRARVYKGPVCGEAAMLHRLYTWQRIVGESTFVLQDEVGRRTRKRFRYSGGNSIVITVTSDDTPCDNMSLASPSSAIAQDHHFRSQRRHEQVFTLDDEHLSWECGRSWDSQRETQRLPLTWLRLVSQVTRLGTLMDEIRGPTCEVEGKLLTYISTEATCLEHAISSFKVQDHHRHATDEEMEDTHDDQSDDEPHNLNPGYHNLLHAFHKALLILFYRRIRHISSNMLQDLVNEVIDSLEAFEEEMIEQQKPVYVPPWPAFLAGAEAVSQSSRQRLSQTIDRALKGCGNYSFRAAKDMLEEVWSRYDESMAGGAGGDIQDHRSCSEHSRSDEEDNSCSKQSGVPTWVDVCREKKLWLMLC